MENKLIPDREFYYTEEKYLNAVKRYQNGEDVKMVENPLYIKQEKYYTPTIDEFHVGFEYYFSSAYQEGVSATEIVIDGRDGYELETFNFNVYNYTPNKGESWLDIFTSMLEHNQMKVKYLDKEDIESLGFKHIGNAIDIWYEKEGEFQIGSWTSYKIQIHYGRSDNRLYINAIDSGEEHKIFEGYIKNKSELIVLLKQLNIC